MTTSSESNHSRSRTSLLCRHLDYTHHAMDLTMTSVHRTGLQTSRADGHVRPVPRDRSTGPRGWRPGHRCRLPSLYPALILILFLGSALAQPPVPSPGLSYHLVEERPLDSMVGNVKRDSGLADRHPNQPLTFHFLTQPRTNFIIENSTGVIRTSGRIDRDGICPRQVSGQQGRRRVSGVRSSFRNHDCD